MQCVIVKIKIIKEQEASGLLNSLEIKTPLSKIPFSRSSFVLEVLAS